MKIVDHRQDKDGNPAPVFITNAFAGYLERLQKNAVSVKLNPVHEIVKVFFEIRGMDKMPKSFYRGRYAYPKLAREAKDLLGACDGKLDDALWCLDKMKYLAVKGHFEWTIRTCLKHNLI